MRQRNLLLAAGTCLIASFLFMGVATSIMDRAQAACGTGWRCNFAGLGEAEGLLLASFAFFGVACVLAGIALVTWLLAKHRAYAARLELRRLERDVERLERELAD